MGVIMTFDINLPLVFSGSNHARFNLFFKVISSLYVSNMTLCHTLTYYRQQKNILLAELHCFKLLLYIVVSFM